MAKRRKKTKKRTRRAKRPIVLQIPAPRRRRNPPKRRKRARRRRRRNSAAATVVNPPMVTYQAANPRRRRRRRRNPSIVQAFKGTLKKDVLVPIVIGGGLGVVGISLATKYIAPRLSTKWQAVALAGIGLVGLPLVNRLYKGAGPYFTGFMVGSALTKVVVPLLPWGEYDDDDLVDGDLGVVEFIGDLSGEGDMDDEEGDAAAAGDGGLDDIMSDGKRAYVVDGLGVLPPMPIPGGFPGALMGRLRRSRLGWLARMGLDPSEIRRILRLGPMRRRGALMRLRAAYRHKREQAEQTQGARFTKHPLVVKHPKRRPRAPKRGKHVVTRGGVRRVARPRRRGRGKFGDMDDPMVEIIGAM